MIGISWFGLTCGAALANAIKAAMMICGRIREMMVVILLLFFWSLFLQESQEFKLFFVHLKVQNLKFVGHIFRICIVVNLPKILRFFFIHKSLLLIHLKEP